MITRGVSRTSENPAWYVKWAGMNISDMAKYNIASPETLKRISGRFSDSFKSGITDALELKNMRGRFWFIPPGENISTPHKHGVQEEIYYQIKGPGKILFGKGGEEVLEVPEGSVVSVPPETWRQVYNDTEEEHIWLIIGSPAVENDGIH